MKLVFATNNAHKLEEARRILGGKIEILSLAEIGCHDDIPETADTLEGNALQKAHWVKDRYGYSAFADDTGLMVDALGGAPGVYTARYAGPQCSPDDNIAKMLRELEGVESGKRGAHFATVVALVDDEGERCFKGVAEGSIATSRHGREGFGYDPIFIDAESGKCFAELLPAEKDAVSHRGKAMRAFAEYITSKETETPAS